MRFTIGIPVRNGEKYLSQAIKSALLQRRPADEILIVDDASTDRTKEICASSEWADRIRYVYNDKPSGFANAFNRVGKLASGDFYVPLSADDLLDPNYLFRVGSALERYPSVKFSFVGSNYVDGNGVWIKSTPTPHELEPRLMRGTDYSRLYLRGVDEDRHIHRCVGIAIERELFVQNCRFRKEAGLITDDDFFYRVGKYTDVIGISAPLATVRIHPDSISSGFDSLNLRLAEDYVFLLHSLKGDPGGLDDGSILTVAKIGGMLINRLLGEALRSGELDLLKTALEVATSFEQIAPENYVARRSLGDKLRFQVVRLLETSQSLAAAYHSLVLGLRAGKHRWLDPRASLDRKDKEIEVEMSPEMRNG